MAQQQPDLQCERKGDVLVVGFQNVSLLDDASYKLVMDRITSEGEAEPVRGLVLNMEGVKLVSTAIWGKLFVLSRKLQKDGGALAVCALGPLLRDAVRVLRLDRLLSVADTVEDALRDVRR
jgi:anti-anti-sigma factor